MSCCFGMAASLGTCAMSNTAVRHSAGRSFKVVNAAGGVFFKFEVMKRVCERETDGQINEQSLPSNLAWECGLEALYRLLTE